MERYEELNTAAAKKLKIADHIVNSTYYVVQDPKLLMSAIESLFLSLTYAMGSLLHFELLYKRIPRFEDKFEEKFTLFNRYIIPRYGIDTKYLKMMRQLKEIILDHQKSPVEFIKNNELVICDDDYRFKKVGSEQIKAYIQESKSFISEINEVISNNSQMKRKI